MKRYANHAPVSNQPGVQNIHGDVIFNDLGPAYKRFRRIIDGSNSTQMIDDEIKHSLAFPQMLDRRSNIDAVHPQTCQWLPRLTEYRLWRSEPRGLLWIKGKPGSGKSTLMSHLHRTIWLEGQFDHDISLEFFFNARGSSLQYAFAGMLRSLMIQIFQQNPDIRQHLRTAYREKISSFGSSESAQWTWQLPELKRFFVDAVLASAQQRQVVLLVDALDEAGAEAAREIASYFHNINDQVNKSAGMVKICISCRHYPISSTIEAAEICMESNNYDDIVFFVKDHIEKANPVADKNRQDRDLIVKTLVDRADGMFQWVRLVTPIVKKWLNDGDTTGEIRTSLSKVPSDLGSVYEHILRDVIDPRHRKSTLRLFQWVCLAPQPMSIKELRYAIAAGDIEVGENIVRCHETSDFETSGLLMSRRIVAWSGGLLEAIPSDRALGKNNDQDGTRVDHDEMVVQVIHQSVKEFIGAWGLSYLLSLNHDCAATNISPHSVQDPTQAAQISHGILYLSCLKYLCTETPLEPYRGEYYSNHEVEVGFEVVQSRHPFLKYSLSFGLEHAEKSANHRGIHLEDESWLLDQCVSMWNFGSRIWEDLKYDLLPELHNTATTTVLHLACAANLINLVEYRIKCGDEVDQEDPTGWTPMCEAAARGNLSVVKILYDAGADMPRETLHHETPLNLAATNGHTGTFVFLLGNLDGNVSALNKQPETALYNASLKGRTAICRLCIEAGADVNAQGGQYGNALQAAALTHSGKVDTVRLLLGAGADVNAQGGRFGNALQAAALSSKVYTVRLLLEAGADVNARGWEYGNALQAAAATHSGIDTVRLLLEAGADVNAQGGEYGNALQAAALSDNIDIVHLLLEAGADVNAQGGYYGYALQAAAYFSNVDNIRLLLRAGADINAQGGRYGNALQAAAAVTGNRNVDIVRLLLEAGADINAQGGYYGNALQAALHRGNFGIVRVLFEAGFEISALDQKYSDALCIAATRFKYGKETVYDTECAMDILTATRLRTIDFDIKESDDGTSSQIPLEDDREEDDNGMAPKDSGTLPVHSTQGSSPVQCVVVEDVEKSPGTDSFTGSWLLQMLGRFFP